jgi:DNA primase
MGIVDEDVVRVRDSSDIVAVVTQHTALRKVGQRFQGLCPFHAEKSPSFSVNAEQNLYYCFGCQAKGDVITFVRETEHLDFVGAVEYLANKAGVTLRYTDKVEGESRKKKARLTAALAKAVEWYHERLLSSDDAATARGYLRSRGLDGDQVREYKIGWAPDTWDSLSKALRLPDDVWQESGLGRLNRRGGQYDWFRGRVLFPIFDVQGEPVGFGGRVMPGGEGAKYINSFESAVYAKSKVLYGLNWMKPAIVEADEAIVCEGYTDVIGFATAGLPRAVATCGTALTEEHVRTLKRFAGRIAIAFDADAAGQAAAERFYEWERSYDIELVVADLPVGVDPADLARTDPPALRKAVEHAVPFLGFRVDRVLGQADLSSPERRARAAEAALAVIAEHPPPWP